MTITLITAGVLGLLLLSLSAYVIAGRLRFKVSLGDGGNKEMQQRIRVQANFIEYVPIALILLMLVESSAIGPAWLPGALGTALVIGRLLHAQGLLSRAGTSVGRFSGTNLTIATILVSSLAVLGRGLHLW